MFFSDEKNQKTFISQQAHPSGQGLIAGAELRVFCFHLVVRKEQS
jgi:hypothetical protein